MDCLIRKVMEGIKKMNKKTYSIIYLILFIVSVMDVKPLYGSSQTIKIGYLPYYGTILDLEDENKIGYGYDYFKEISKYTGWEYEYIPYTWEEGLERLAKGEIDIFGPMQKIPEREEFFDFTEANFGYESGVLYAHKESPFYYEDFEAFNGLKVGIENKNFYQKEMELYCEQHNFEVQFVDSDGSNIEQELREGKYDLFVGGELYNIPNTKIVGEIINRPFYYATTKGNNQLIQVLKEVLKEIRLNNFNFQSNLYRKYYENKLSSMPAFSREELEVVKQHPKLLVEIEPYAAPLQYIDAKTGEGKGIIIDLLDEIGKAIGMEFEYIASTHEEGACAGLADLYAGYHKERYGVPMYLTHKLLSAPMVYVGPSKADLSDDITVAIAQLDNIDMNELARRYPDVTIKEYHTILDVSKALYKGETDFAATSLYTFDELIRRGNDKKYVAYPIGMDLDINLGVSRKLPQELVSVINKGIKYISEDRLDSIIFLNTIQHVNEVSIEGMIKEHFVEIVVSMILILLFILCLIILIVCILYSKKKALQKLAYEDQITTLTTPMKFKMDIKKALKHAKSGEYTLVSLDIDNFNYINNWLGYEEGNEVLRILGENLKNMAKGKALLARESSDIFLLFTKTKYIKKSIPMEYYSERIVQQIPQLEQLDYRLTFNIGIYEIYDVEKDSSYMMDCAHIARRKAKGQYGDSVATYTLELNREIKQQRKIVLEMEHALNHREFMMVLQPKFNLLTGKVQGAEALVRWQKDGSQRVYPNDFIPLFEKNGFIYRLDLYMFEEICRLIKGWQRKGIHPLPKVSVNISKVTLLSEDLGDLLMDKIKKWQISTEFIELELTESAFSENMEQTIQVVAQLKQLGFTVSLDDFGSGYSSLNMLKEITIDTLKIDKEFLGNLVLTDKEVEVIRTIVDIAKVLKIQTVIEGVETKEQVDRLRDIGCDLAQGYYFAKPLSKADFERFML